MLKEKIKAIIVSGKTKDNKKKIENVVVLILILIITIIAINTIWNGDNNETKQEQITTTTKQLAEESTLQNNNEEDIQTKLENILTNINGVGKVKVLISYSESSEVVAMYNENSKNSQIEEKDSGGGTRITTQEDIQKDIIYKEENGEKVPITQKIVSPKIEGAIIAAQGAGSASIKNDIILAVEAVTGLSTHKIQVFEMRKD